MDKAISAAQSIQQPSKRRNVVAAIEAFRNSSFARRDLHPMAKARKEITADGVRLLLSPDLVVRESNRTRYLFLAFGATSAKGESAQLVVDAAYFLLRKLDGAPQPTDIEFQDVRVRKEYRARARVEVVDRLLHEHVGAIKRTWEEV